MRCQDNLEEDQKGIPGSSGHCVNILAVDCFDFQQHAQMDLPFFCSTSVEHAVCSDMFRFWGRAALHPSEIDQDEPLRKMVHEQTERIRAQGESQMAQELMSAAPATIETADTMNVILEGPALDWNTVEARQIRFGTLTCDAA